MKREKPPPLKIQRPVGSAAAHAPAPQYRPPVIIHTYSPEVIQTDSRDFMQLVQRLTGSHRNGGSRSPLDRPFGGKRPRVAPEHRRPPQASSAAPPPELAPPPPFPQHHRNQTSTTAANGPKPHHLPPLLVPKPIYRSPVPLPPLHNPNPNPNPNSGHGEAPPDVKPVPFFSPNPLLSPSFFDFSPSVLPSPSTFNFDFPTPQRGILPSPPPPFAVGGRGGLRAPFSPLLARGILPSPPAGAMVPLSPLLASPPPGLGLSLRASPGPYSFDFSEIHGWSPAAYAWGEKRSGGAGDAVSGGAHGAAAAQEDEQKPLMMKPEVNIFRNKI